MSGQREDYPVRVMVLCAPVMPAFALLSDLMAVIVLGAVLGLGLRMVTQRARLTVAALLTVVAAFVTGFVQNAVSGGSLGRGSAIQLSSSVFTIVFLAIAIGFVAMILLGGSYRRYIEENALIGTADQVKAEIEARAEHDPAAARARNARLAIFWIFACLVLAITAVSMIEALLGTGWTHET